MKRLTVITIPLLLLLAYGCGGGDTGSGVQANVSSGQGAPGETAQTGEVKVTNVETYTVTPIVFDERLTLPVAVMPYREASLGLTGGGKVVKINTDKGDRVSKGDVLLETDIVLLRANRDLAKSTLEYQQKEFERSERLFNDGSITEAAYDAAKLQLAQAKSSWEIAEKQLDDATLKAPFGGVITMRNVELGDILGAGTPAFRLIDMNRVKIQAGIPEKYISDFKEGSEVQVEFDAFPGKVFQGKIDYISPEGDPGVRTFLAEIVADNKSGDLKAGIMGNAKLLRRQYKDANMIPLNSLIDTQDGRIVFVAGADNRAEQRNVEIGNASNLMVQVLSGISAGERVITKGHYDLLDGEQIKVTGEYAAGNGEEN